MHGPEACRGLKPALRSEIVLIGPSDAGDLVIQVLVLRR